MVGHILFWILFSQERLRAAIDADGVVGGPLRHLAMSISKRLERRAERRHLQSLDDHRPEVTGPHAPHDGAIPVHSEIDMTASDDIRVDWRLRRVM
jgi:hypothetical protein